MPSSSKTPSLGLNKWLGTDKPKKDDFNADNQKMDDAHKALAATVTANGQSLATHTGNTASHITAAERALWNSKDKMATGKYTGNGAASRKITLGFAPRAGFLYAVGEPVSFADCDAGNNNYLAGFISTSGSTYGITADSTGFTVTQHPAARPNGRTSKLNDASFTYIYTVWP